MKRSGEMTGGKLERAVTERKMTSDENTVRILNYSYQEGSSLAVKKPLAGYSSKPRVARSFAVAVKYR